MKTCEYAGGVFPELRSHPWLGSTTDLAAHYYDLTACPQLIRSALEDFVPWSRYGAIETFYALLQRLNHTQSPFETSDCEFTGPHHNDQPEIPKALVCSGRLMLLFRELEQNTVEASLASLKHAIHSNLAELDEAFLWGMVGTTLVPTRYSKLPESDGQQLGNQLMISFWAWGDSEASTMLNLDRLFKNLGRALRNLSVGTPA